MYILEIEKVSCLELYFGFIYMRGRYKIIYVVYISPYRSCLEIRILHSILSRIMYRFEKFILLIIINIYDSYIPKLSTSPLIIELIRNSASATSNNHSYIYI